MRIFTDTSTNVISVAVTMGVLASLLMRDRPYEYRPWGDVWMVPPFLRTIYFVLVSSFGLFNLFGVVTDKHWQGFFGTKFVPTTKLGAAEKRRAVGILELVLGIGLSLFGEQ
jgi:hypothetical protein